MATDRIDWEDKEDVKVNAKPEKNKGTAATWNKVKSVVNNNADEIDNKLDKPEILIGEWDFLADWDESGVIAPGEIRNLDGETADANFGMFFNPIDKNAVDHTTLLEQIKEIPFTLNWYEGGVLVHTIINTVTEFYDSVSTEWWVFWEDPPNTDNEFDFGTYPADGTVIRMTIPAEYVTEAPDDGLPYVRQNKSWAKALIPQVDTESGDNIIRTVTNAWTIGAALANGELGFEINDWEENNFSFFAFSQFQSGGSSELPFILTLPGTNMTLVDSTDQGNTAIVEDVQLQENPAGTWLASENGGSNFSFSKGSPANGVDVYIGSPIKNVTTIISSDGSVEIIQDGLFDFDLSAGIVKEIIPGANISVDNSDPKNPIVSSFTGTSAGLITPLFVTGEEEVLAAGTFYKTLRNDKGSVGTVQQVVVANDNTVEWFLQDAISVQAITDGEIPVGTYGGFFSIERNNTAGDAVRFGAEVYLTDADGNVTDVGVPLANPIGSYGVRIMALISTGNVEPPTNSETQENVTGVVPLEVPYVAGQRFRYRFFGEKVGTQGSNVTLSLYFGFDHNTYLEVPVIVTTDDVFNASDVPGATSTDAFNHLNNQLSDPYPAPVVASDFVGTWDLASNAWPFSPMPAQTMENATGQGDPAGVTDMAISTTPLSGSGTTAHLTQLLNDGNDIKITEVGNPTNSFIASAGDWNFIANVFADGSTDYIQYTVEQVWPLGYPAIGADIAISSDVVVYPPQKSWIAFDFAGTENVGTGPIFIDDIPIQGLADEYLRIVCNYKWNQALINDSTNLKIQILIFNAAGDTVVYRQQILIPASTDLALNYDVMAEGKLGVKLGDYAGGQILIYVTNTYDEFVGTIGEQTVKLISEGVKDNLTN